MIEKCVGSSNSKLKRIYTKKYYQILDVIDDGIDFQDINEILLELAQPSQNSFISEIKE